MSVETENKQRVRAFFEAMNAGDAERIAAAYAEDGYVWTMGDTLISGKSGKAEILAAAGGIFEVFPKGIRFTLNSMIAEGEQVAVVAESEGEHVSGQTYRNMYHFLFSFDRGELKELREYMDTEKVTDVLCGGQRPG